MTARERILSIKLLEKQARNPEYARRIGIQVNIAYAAQRDHLDRRN